MALWTHPNCVGEFQHKETNAWFTYKPTSFEWAKQNGLDYEIHMCDGSVRYANVMKTIAYVCIDEDENGKAVVEHWPLKKHSIWIKKNEKMQDLFEKFI